MRTDLAMAADIYPPAPRAARALSISVEGLRGRLLWLTGLAGAFVFMEPSPYEFVSLVAIIVFAATGLTLRPAIMPLVLLLILYCIGFSIAVTPLLHLPKPLVWVVVSWYMAATAVFFAAVLANSTADRLDMLTRGWTAAAVIASLIAVLAYFKLLPFSDLFLRYDRARSTFNDPNVFGAFLVFPALLALGRVMTGRPSEVLRAALVLALVMMALLLSFSRAAWGQFAGTATLFMILMMITSRSPAERMRIVGLGALGVLALALLVLALLSLDQVAGIFKERATLDQSYDAGRFGRFGRYSLGFSLALDQPFGIGPLQFSRFFPEDPHNSFLNAFMSGGWIAGACYPVLVCLTIIYGLRFVAVRTPWQPAYLAIFCAYVGVVAESLIIDIEHWRHYYLLLGMLWGLIAASRAYLARTPGLAHAPVSWSPHGAG